MSNNHTIDLSQYTKAPKSKKSKNTDTPADPRDKSSYTLLTNVKAITVKEFIASPEKIAPVNHVYLEDEKVFVVSPLENLQYIPADILKQAIAAGQKDIVAFSAGQSNIVHNLFFSKEAPRTKSNGHWFGLTEDNKPVFVVLQGTGIKIVRS